MRQLVMVPYTTPRRASDGSVPLLMCGRWFPEAVIGERLVWEIQSDPNPMPRLRLWRWWP